MVRFPEATQRLFGSVFVCRKCKRKIRADPQKILQKIISCRGCGGKSFRAIKKTTSKK